MATVYLVQRTRNAHNNPADYLFETATRHHKMERALKSADRLHKLASPGPSYGWSFNIRIVDTEGNEYATDNGTPLA
jgi:hypothetical protein